MSTTEKSTDNRYHWRQSAWLLDLRGGRFFLDLGHFSTEGVFLSLKVPLTETSISPKDSPRNPHQYTFFISIGLACKHFLLFLHYAQNFIVLKARSLGRYTKRNNGKLSGIPVRLKILVQNLFGCYYFGGSLNFSLSLAFFTNVSRPKLT